MSQSSSKESEKKEATLQAMVEARMRRARKRRKDEDGDTTEYSSPLSSPLLDRPRRKLRPLYPYSEDEIEGPSEEGNVSRDSEPEHSSMECEPSLTNKPSLAAVDLRLSVSSSVTPAPNEGSPLPESAIKTRVKKEEREKTPPTPSKMKKSRRKSVPEKNKGLQAVKSPISTNISDTIKALQMEVDSKTANSDSCSNAESQNQSATVFISTPPDTPIKGSILEQQATMAAPTTTESDLRVKIEARPQTKLLGASNTHMYTVHTLKYMYMYTCICVHTVYIYTCLCGQFIMYN